MADKRITELNLVTNPLDSDVFALVNNSETKKIPFGSVKDIIHETYNTSSLVTTNNFTNFSSSITNQVNNLTSATSSYVTISQTGSFVESAYISLYDTGSQPLLTSGSEQVVTFSSQWAAEGISLVSGSQITFDKAGVYNFSFVAQVTNLDNAVHDSYFWIKYNGSNFPNSATRMTLDPRKNASIGSAQLMTMNIVGIALNDNDNIELYWTGDNLLTSLSESPATAVIPETPSIIANVTRVG